MEEKHKTEQQLREEIGALIRELGVRHYSKHLIETEIAQLSTRLVALNTEVFNRQQVRQAIEAEAAAAASTSEAAPAPEAAHE